MLKKLKLSKSAKTGTKGTNQVSPDYIVGLDVGTENVKALIGRVVDDDIEVVGVGRAHQALSDMQAGAVSDIAGVFANCDQALSQAEQMAGVSARGAVLGIAGELVKGLTTSVRLSRKDPNKPLDIPEIEKIIGLVQARALKNAKQELSWELGGKDIEIRLVNSALVSVSIDGHPVSSPMGFQGRDVSIQLYAAFAPLVHIGALEKVASELGLELLAVAAEPFAVARSVIGNDPNASTSAILMDIGGGTTDIAVLNEGGVEGTKMFGIGGRAYTKAIERDLSTDFEQAEALKIALSANKLPTQKRRLVEQSLEKTLDVWMSGVELALAEFDHLDNLPNKILLCGGGASLDMIQSELLQSNWYKNLPFTRKPVVQLISPDEVYGIVDKTGSVDNHTYITALGLLRVGLDTMGQSSQSKKSIKDRFNSILSI
ncbi:pilus assembly protein PilM [Candidatus Saccharibacteria bacterium]|nr:pilus assembly protein PilM [Candidatus Saccharibacteria bacterium]